MQPPTVDRFRYPYRAVVPGDLHTIIISWEPSSLAGNTYGASMFDAMTGVPVPGVTYTPNLAGAADGQLIFTAAIPPDLDTTKLYEIRIRQLTPSVETLIAGYVSFPPTTIAGTA